MTAIKRSAATVLLGVLVHGASLQAAAELTIVRSVPRAPDEHLHRPGSSRVEPTPPETIRASGQIADTCPAFDLGTVARFGSFSGSTIGLSNNFGVDGSCGSTCGTYGGTATDGIVTFQVPAGGSWTFSTCGGADFDTALQLRTGPSCPGTTCVDQEDDNCNNCALPYEAFVTGSLTTGTAYYLIVDGYSGGGGNFKVTYSGPCANGADCDDGLFCNGVESCVSNHCQGGTPPCGGNTPFCNEQNHACTGCTSNAQCINDGMFCNGVEFCNLQTGFCENPGSPCNPIQLCNELLDNCTNPPPGLAYAQPYFDPEGQFFAQDPSANPCWSPNFMIGDDIRLSSHAGHKLVNYSVLVRSGNLPGFPADGNYNLTTELWSVDPSPGSNHGLPLAPIAGTQCIFTNRVAGPGQSASCSPVGEVILPDDPAGTGVDFYVIIKTSRRTAGFQIANAPRQIGGPGLDDLFAPSNPGPVFVMQDSSASCTGAWRYSQFMPPLVSDMIINVITTPIGPCCLAEGGCALETAADCNAGGGTFKGVNEILNPQTCSGPLDGDGDGTRDECDLCLKDSGKDSPGPCGCGTPDTDSDGDEIADCQDGCPLDANKVAPGACGCGVAEVDTDGDGTKDCIDGCPQDPGKIAPGICGCGISDLADADHDNVPDCSDLCPDVDDELFAPGCVGAIPAVSQWGVIIMTLLLLTAGKLYFGRRPLAA